jgi:hypothetical protein
MAVPTTRASLETRTVAVIVELGELAAGAHTLSGGSDGGTSAQLSACGAIKTRLRGAHKEFLAAGVTDVVHAIS